MTWRHTIQTCILCLALLASGNSLQARDPEFITKNSEGREFWLCFMKNFRSAGLDVQNRQATLRLQLFITSSYDANVSIDIEEIDYHTTIEVRANTVVPVQIPARAQLRALETAERLAVYIKADTTISVYGLNSRYQTTDTFLGLPTAVLGKEYRAVGYTKLASDLLSAVSIVATEDDTEIEITPTATTSTGRPPGVPFKIRLRKGDVYTVGARWESIGPCDLTGTRIVSNKKVAVFSGHNCAYVPSKVEACNHLVEQLPPVTAWGLHYYVGNLKERSRYTYRVIASENKTRVFENSKLISVLNAGELYESLNTFNSVQITADKPILVAQFAQGFKNGDSVGDPMMILVSPTQQFLNQYRFATPISGDWHHYINVVSPTENIGQLRLNGKRVDSTLFTVLGESRYSLAQIQVPYGTHVIRSEVPFGLYSYGFGYKSDAYDAYGNMAGQSFFELNTLVDSVPPTAEAVMVRDEFSVTFRDDRVMDRGLASIAATNTLSLEAIIPKIEPGTPQVTVKVRPALAGKSGRLVFEAFDVAGNRSRYSICYVFDSRSERYTFTLNDDPLTECIGEETWIVGAYGIITNNYQTASFSSVGDLHGQSDFGASEGVGGGFGLLIGKRVLPDVILNGRLSVSSVGGTLVSPDSTISSVLDTASGTIVPYQEATTLSLSAPYLKLGGAAQWFVQRFFYLMGGVNIAIAIGNSAETQKTVLRPTGWMLPSGTPTMPVGSQSVTTLSTLGLEVFGGLGFSYPVSFHSSLFMEAVYTNRLGSLATDASWKLESFGLNVGLLYRL